jgi:hypothetical protein
MDMILDIPVRQQHHDSPLLHKRPLNIEENEEEEEDRPTKKTKLDIRIDQDYFEIEGIKDRPLPREDGREWSFWEKTEKAENARPYGKTYLTEQAERIKILSEHPDYQFFEELAGALRKQPYEIFEEEDLDRMMREREQERMQNEIELRRTRIDMGKKDELIQRLKSYAREYRDALASRQIVEVQPSLLFISKYLIDNTDLPPTINNSQYYGFLELQELETEYKNAPQQVTKFLNETLGAEERLSLSQKEGASEFYYDLHLYYRDFLNNDSIFSIRDAIELNIKYIVDHFTEITGRQILAAIKVEPENTTTTTKTASDFYEIQIEALTQELGGGGDEAINPWRELRRFFSSERKDTSGVNWQLYKKKNSETVDLFYFNRLNISHSKEEAMARAGGASAYATSYSNYYEKAMLLLYGTSEQKDAAQRGTRGINLLSDVQNDGGHPPEIISLIQIQFPDYKTSHPIDQIQSIMKAHFIWLYFESTPWKDIINLLYDERHQIQTNIEETFAEMAHILERTIALYKVLLLAYFRAIVDVLEKQRSLLGAPLLSLPLNVTALLRAAPSTLANEVNLFDQVSAAFKQITLRDLVADDLFYNYLVTGNNAFVSRMESNNIPIEDTTTRTTTSKSGLTPPQLLISEEYPILLLHSIFKFYTKYAKQYIDFLQTDLLAIEEAIRKATNKIAQVVGDESYSVNNNNTDYRQRKAFTTQPINSGFVKLKAEIIAMLRRAYTKTQQYCPSLLDMPMEGFQSASARATGLQTNFIEFVVVVTMVNELRVQDSFKTQIQYKLACKSEYETMHTLKSYSYRKINEHSYEIIRDLNQMPQAFHECNTYRCCNNSSSDGNVFIF